MSTMLENLRADGYLPYLIGGGVVIATGLLYLLKRSLDNHLVDAPKDTVVLRQAPRGPYAPCLSPFPLKLETYLRMMKIPYKNVFGLKPSPRTGKTPWVQFNGEILTDSQFIIEYLNKYFNINSMSHLSSSEQAVARAFMKMIEESTFWCMARWRLLLDPSDFIRKNVKVPLPLLWYVRRVYRQYLYGQGMGRLTPEEMYHIFEGDLKALSSYLGDKNFLFGDKPCEVDCAIFGQLAQFKWQTPGSPLQSTMNSLPNLHAYCDRMKEAFWPDWDECITHGLTKKATK